MNRHPVLLALSQAHKHALEQAQALERVAASATEDGTSRATAGLHAAIRSFLEFTRGPWSNHTQIEQDVIVPALERLQAGHMVERMVADHTRFDAAAAELAAAAEARGTTPRRLARLAHYAAVLVREHVQWTDRDLLLVLQHELGSGAAVDLGGHADAS
jgi:hypothetical protein